MAKINNYINHIVFVVDKSSSISQRGLTSTMVKVFDSQIQYLAQRSKELAQETRVTVYLFADNTECVIFDKDVLRLPSLAELYSPHGNTDLVGSTLLAIEDLNQTFQKYGDHSFLAYVLTDGEHNRGSEKIEILKKKIESLPENWTVACFVPNQNGVFEAKKFGFPANNISVWNTDAKGVAEVGETMKTVTNNYMTARAAGVRGTKNLFNLDTTKLTKTVIKSNLKELNPNEYYLLHVRKDGIEIKDFVESWKLPYIQGSAYFQLTKPEKIQAGKQVCIKNKLDGKVYAGTQAREIIGLPNHEVKVGAANYGDWLVFPQSTSVNRKLVGGTELIVVK
jgi:hypothetical protein